MTQIKNFLPRICADERGSTWFVAQDAPKEINHQIGSAEQGLK
jgi:hypothetical protein